jgi:superfamily II RNA helicase
MGLEKIAQCWNLPLPSKSITDQIHSIEMSWIDFQLLHLGPELEREMGSSPDKRVEGFVPDKWQIKLFDCVDKHQSALVVAPTSSGKTYASYYCMEKVLRESNDGVVVYVAPTKALVNQVAATIYARFKNKDMPAGKSVYGIFTRDYRTNALNSQILVTVPECLALLLLSPRRHGWVRNLRYVIFDEIHCLAGQLGGFSLECGLLLIRCPFLALSATVENPESLHTWFQSMQCFKHMQDITNGCENPDTFYKVELVVYKDRHADLTKHVYCEDGQFRHIHPYTYLDQSVIEMGKGIPQHITLSPEEVHDLYIAMNFACSQDPRLSELQPEKFFSKCTDGFISRNMVRDFEAELRKLLENWVTEDKTAFEVVVLQLRRVEDTLGIGSETRFIVDNFIPFVQKLQGENMLPTIVFSYNRSLVRWSFERATEHYEDVAQECEEKKEESMLVDRKECRKDEVMQEGSKKNKRAGCIDENDFCVSRGVPGRNKYEVSLNLLHSASTNSSLIRSMGHADKKIVKFVERKLLRMGYKEGSTFPRGLSMGVGIHHGGLNAKERSAVEMFFRKKVLKLVFATGTLALGIHMPCKTVAVIGDSPYLNPLEFQQMSGRAGRQGFDTAGNVFMGLNERKMCMLLTCKLPNMVGNFPLNVTMVVQLLLIVSDITSDGAHSEEVTRDALSRYVP